MARKVKQPVVTDVIVTHGDIVKPIDTGDIHPIEAEKTFALACRSCLGIGRELEGEHGACKVCSGTGWKIK